MTTQATGKQERVKIATPEFRASFPSVFQARKVNQTDPNEKAKFSIQMLFRVTETAESKKRGEKVVDITPLKQAVMKILADKLGAGWQAEVRKTKGDGSPLYRLPFRNGDSPEKKDTEGYGPGIVFCTASSVMKPGVIDGQKNDILDPADVYGGCYMRATVSPFWYDTRGNKGVSFGLQNIQKIRDGEPFSGRTKATDDFDAIEAPAGATAGAAAGAETGDPLGL